MTTVELLSHLRSLDVRLWVEDDRLRYSAPDGVLTPDLRAQLVQHKAEIIAFLRQAKTAVHHVAPPILPVSRDEELPLSFAQERLWVLDQLTADGFLYNISEAIRLVGSLDVVALEQTINEIVRRHEALRTTFPAVEGRPVQRIASTLGFELPVVDLRELRDSERVTEVQKLAVQESKLPFDLARGPLLRVTLLHLAPHEHVILFTMHHIISDGWSMGVLVREVAKLYEAFSHGRPSPLPELPIQYADFAHWQRQWLQGEVLESQLSYWREQLEGLPTLELPADRPRPKGQTYRGAFYAFALPETLSESLKELTRDQDVTLFMTLLAAFQTLLYCYTGQEDIPVGMPIANRNRAELEGLIGFFVNTLVLRTDLSGDPSFLELLGRVREVALGAYSHQDVPFDKVVESLERQRRQVGASLVNVAFALQNAPTAKLELPDLTFDRLEVDSAMAKTDLMLFMSEGPTGLNGMFVFNTDLFDRSTVVRIAGDFQDVLETVVSRPETRLSEVPLAIGKELPSPKGKEGPEAEFDEIFERSNLTKNQLLMWLGQKLQPEVPLFNIANTFTIYKAIIPEHFQKAFQTLINSSDALRTVIVEIDGVPHQKVLASLPYDMAYLDFSHLPNPQAELQAWVKQRCQVLFELDKCLFDSVLIKMADQEYVWYFNQHHIIADAWSKALIFNRLAELYRSSLKGRLAEKIELPAFQDYLDYERQYRKSPRYLKAKAYWERRLGEELEPLIFYGKSPRKRTTHVRRVSVDLGVERTQRVKEIAAQKNYLGRTGDVWVFNIFATVLFAYLHRMSGNRRLALGAAFHNRRSQAFKETIGIFMEVRPLLVTIEEKDNFSSLLKKVAIEVGESFQHRHYAIANPLHKKAYDVFLNYHTATFPEFCGAPVRTEWVHSEHENDTLAIQVHDYDRSGKFVLDFDFHCDVFDDKERVQVIEHFLEVLDSFLANPARRVKDVSLLSAEARERILNEFSRAKGEYPEDQTILDLMKKRLEKTPDKIATVYKGSYLTFQELDSHANKLANLILRLRNDPE